APRPTSERWRTASSRSPPEWRRATTPRSAAKWRGWRSSRWSAARRREWPESLEPPTPTNQSRLRGSLLAVANEEVHERAYRDLPGLPPRRAKPVAEYRFGLSQRSAAV